MRYGAIVLLALGSTGFTVVRDTSSLVPITWTGASATMVLQQDGSDDVSDGSDLLAMRAAMAVWARPSCTSFHFLDGGTSPNGGDGQDSTNRISFLESGWPGGAGSGAVALTNRRRSGSHWTEADVIVNGQFRSWATNGDVHRYDIQSTLTHELGHVLGLQHSALPTASMFFAARPGLTHARTLAPDDVAGLCFLYPKQAFQCAGDGDCPLYDGSIYGGTSVRTRCNAGSCASGGVGFGSACFANGDCTSGSCVADPDQPGPDDPGTCTQSCTLGGSDCPSGARCVSTGVGARCFPDRDDCSEHTDCAGGNWRCEAQLDGRFACQLLCVTNTHCASVAGAVCQGGIDGSNPGWCRVPGPGGAGDPCDDGLECESLLCTSGGATPTCTGGIAPPEDDGGPVDPGPDGDEPTDDDPPPADQGGTPTDDDPTEGDAPSPTTDYDVSYHPDEPAVHAAGCGCSGTTATSWLVSAVVLVLALRRRHR